MLLFPNLERNTGNVQNFPTPRFIQTNGIRMAVYEQGTGQPVIFLHGFPDLAYSWRHQLPALADAGFRAVAVDQRGYGNTDCPFESSDYRIETLIADIRGLLDNLQVERAIFVGHDWGALLLWHMALVAPERILRQVILNIPYRPRPASEPIAQMRARLGDDFYIVNFQDSDDAERAFDADPAHFFDMMMRVGQISRPDFDALPNDRKAFSLIKAVGRKRAAGRPLLNDSDQAYFVESFTRHGMRGPINWYRNWTHNWESLSDVEQTVRTPTLFIGAIDDVIVPMSHFTALKTHVTNLQMHMLQDCGHWTQQEQPAIVNRLILNWLREEATDD